MTLPLYRAHFNDECPAIGAGWRFIWVKEGRKWAYLVYAPTALTVRMKLATFEGLHADACSPSSHLIELLAARIVALGREPTRLETEILHNPKRRP